MHRPRYPGGGGRTRSGGSGTHWLTAHLSGQPLESGSPGCANGAQSSLVTQPLRQAPLRQR